MQPKKRQLQNLPFTEMAKSGTLIDLHQNRLKTFFYYTVYLQLPKITSYCNWLKNSAPTQTYICVRADIPYYSYVVVLQLHKLETQVRFPLPTHIVGTIVGGDRHLF